jgi:conjugative transfer signal peptidase TraF
MIFPMVLFFIFGLALQFGIIINTTPSMPIGFYLKKDKLISRDDIILFRLPDHRKPLLKLAMAIPGDDIELQDNYIRINQKKFKLITFHQDRQGHDVLSYPRGIYEKTSGYWMFSFHPYSWDSRYFGPIHSSQVIAVLKPLLII